MHQLGDQWIELIDGAEHMLKAVEGGSCSGCVFYDWYEGHLCKSKPERVCGGFNIIKDLGILKNGVLPSPFPDGGYPTIQRGAHWGEEEWVDCYWAVYKAHKIYICTGQFPTEQEAKNAWNRRY